MKWPTFRDLFIGITIPISGTGHVRENENKDSASLPGRDDEARKQRAKDDGFLESRKIITGGKEHGNTGETKNADAGQKDLHSGHRSNRGNDCGVDKWSGE